MGLREAFGTNKAKEQEGSWIDCFVNEDLTLCRMKVKRLNSNKPFSADIASLVKKYGKVKGDNSDFERRATIESFCKHLLVKWENVENIFTDIDEKYLPYSYENAKRLFEELPDLFNLLIEEATDLGNYQDEIREEEAKNFPPSSITA